ncbi:hypothetical protein [Bradyrhizobium liaoningense]|uniref:hypothetical protein n=1 Tax=Bradyrhizobium liaoningense TaxID=43992 RepID=UPI001BAE53FB|nr:hypothetical protein [Bradyrhizobium liaoningense]MBR0822406.1 hypothetical protein [Bradyrhizobium liaoningense]
MKKIIEESVQSIDQETGEVWFRSGVLGRGRGIRQPEAMVRAKSRRRTARWRATNDRARRPEAATIAISLLRAVVSARLSELSAEERGIIGAALVDLHRQGYAVSEVLTVCRRLRRRVLADADGAAGP